MHLSVRFILREGWVHRFRGDALATRLTLASLTVGFGRTGTVRHLSVFFLFCVYLAFRTTFCGAEFKCKLTRRGCARRDPDKEEEEKRFSQNGLMLSIFAGVQDATVAESGRSPSEWMCTAAQVITYN